MSNPYDFGFLSSLAAINFPGGWLTIEHTFTCDALAVANGEPFAYTVPSPLPNVPSLPVIFAFGATGSGGGTGRAGSTGANVLHSEALVEIPAGPNTPSSVEKVVYIQVGPSGSTGAAQTLITNTSGAGAAVFDLGSITSLAGINPRQFTFTVRTLGHGSNAPPPVIVPVYFVYASGPGWPYVVTFTETTFAQTYVAPNFGGYDQNNPFTSIGISPASGNRFGPRGLGGTLEIDLVSSTGVMFPPPAVSVPPARIVDPTTWIYGNPFFLQSDAQIMADWFNQYNPFGPFGAGGGPANYAVQKWIAGDTSNPPPPPGKCSWAMVGKLFTKATSIIVSPQGVVTNQGADKTVFATSGGNQPKSYIVTVTVDLDENTLNMGQEVAP